MKTKIEAFVDKRMTWYGFIEPDEFSTPRLVASFSCSAWKAVHDGMWSMLERVICNNRNAERWSISVDNITYSILVISSAPKPLGNPDTDALIEFTRADIDDIQKNGYDNNTMRHRDAYTVLMTAFYGKDFLRWLDVMKTSELEQNS